jgi:signal transduction histidine kinase
MSALDPPASDPGGARAAAWSGTALQRILAVAPRFGDGGHETVAAGVCRELRSAFRADLAYVVRLLDDDHVAVESRDPTSTMMPPGRVYPLQELPVVEDALLGHAAGIAHLRRSLAVPIALEGRASRVIVLEWSTDVPAFDAETLLVLRRVGDQAAQNTRQTHRLLAVGAALAGTRTVDEVAAALLAEGRAQTGADGATVLIAAEATLRVLARDPPDGDDVALVARPDGLPLADVLRRNEIVILESRATRPVGSPFAAAALVPLTAGAAVVGAIEFTFQTEREFAAGDREFFAALGRQGGLALERARLHAKEVRAREEAELRASATQALEYLAEGVVMLDDDHDVVRVWNPAAAAVTGLSAEQVVGNRLDVVLPEWTLFAPRVPVASVGELPAAPSTLPLETPRGELWLSISGIRFDGGLVYAFRDVTADHALDRLKSDFIATISHELRTPLAVMYGGALTLARSDLELTAQARGELLETMAVEGRRLERLVDRILFASTLESDTARPESRLLEPAELARDVVEEMKAATTAPIELEIEPAVEGRVVRVDRDHLRQVVANLVENAVKYSPAGNVVEVRVAASANRVRIAVADDGVGVAAVERERIFDKFFRADSQLTRSVRGTGLGLYIVRELVKRMDGDVWVEPRACGGSVFVVELPSEHAAS